MEILKVKLQIGIALVICVLIYNHINKPPQAAQPEVSMEMVQQQAASGQIPAEAKAAADSMMMGGDLGEFQKQLGAQGMIDP